jgi:prefoldin subunit 5
MNCHVAWNRDFIDSHLSKTFRLNEYKKHRENILVDREKSLLPATVPIVEAEKAAREREKTVKDLFKKRDLLQTQINEINIQINEIRYNHRRFHGEAGPSTPERKQFIRACVMPECRGFLSSQWKCGICTTWVCPDCHEPKASQKDPEHKCDPNNVETAKLLAKDTKPCPKCASMIYKVNGCSQMWCTICHTSFDWNTGQEVFTNNIHNPEYYRYIREKNGGVIPRNLGDIPMACGGMPAFWTVHPFTIKWQKVDGRLLKIQSLHRVLGHIQDIELRRNRPDIFTNNQDLRVSYLLSEISEADWKQELQKREKKREINTARRNVYEMLVTIGTDLMNKLLRSKTAEEIKETIDEFDKVIEYYNDSIRNVAERFGSKSIKVFNEDWIWR